MGDLDDGTYDVIVVDAEERLDGEVVLELAVSSGPHRGDVVRISATGLGACWIDLLGLPGTLLVAGGAPRFAPDT